MQRRAWKIAGVLLLSALALCGLFISCGPYSLDPDAARQQLIQEASSNIPCVAQFRSLYPNAKIGVYSRNFQKGTTQVQLDEIAHDRYLLTMTVHVEVNKRSLHITSSATPLITLLEITNVSGSPLKSAYGVNFNISPSQWSRIVDSHGDFRSAGIDVKTEEPAAGMSLLKAYRTGKDF
jgi:hypothetical protein